MDESSAREDAPPTPVAGGFPVVDPDRSLLEALERFASDLPGPTSDDLDPGAAYEAGLDPDERGARGQFYTPPGLAEAVCRWALRSTDAPPRVLDPAVGGGVFALAALERLRQHYPDRPVQALLDRVVGVDVDPAALSLSARALLDRTGVADVERLHLFEANFLDLDPDGNGGPAGRFDAVVGNPPFVRQEDFDAAAARAHLDALGPAGEAPYAEGPRALSGRCDASVYFLTQATRFLRPGGRLGFVVPAKWLTSRYGADVQRFVHDHYRVHAVVGFAARAFDEALVDTVLLLLERGDGTGPVRFARVDEPVDAATLVATLEDGSGGPMRTVDRPQRVFADADKLGHYLDAPRPVLDLLEGADLVPLSALGSVHRGAMTGANDFFFLESADRVDDRFLAPAIKSIRDVDGRVVRAADTSRYLLDVHDYVAGLDGDPDSAAVREALERDGHDGLAAYVAWGERQGFHERRTCRARRVWFDLGERSPPAVFVPKFFDRRVFAVANPDGLLASNAVDCLDVAPGVDADALLGVLNSTATRAALECWGRAEGGGALQLMTYELSSLPVVDVTAIEPDARDAIAAANRALLDGEAGAADRLDRAVCAVLDVDPDRLRVAREEMVDRRVGRGGAARVPVRPTD